MWFLAQGLSCHCSQMVAGAGTRSSWPGPSSCGLRASPGGLAGDPSQHGGAQSSGAASVEAQGSGACVLESKAEASFSPSMTQPEKSQAITSVTVTSLSRVDPLFDGRRVKIPF